MTTTKAATKRAERERRRANGEVRCEIWLDAVDRARLERITAGNYRLTKQEAISHALFLASMDDTEPLI